MDYEAFSYPWGHTASDITGTGKWVIIDLGYFRYESRINGIRQPSTPILLPEGPQMPGPEPILIGPSSFPSPKILLLAFHLTRRKSRWVCLVALQPHDSDNPLSFPILQGASCSRAFSPTAAAAVIREHCCVGPESLRVRCRTAIMLFWSQVSSTFFIIYWGPQGAFAYVLYIYWYGHYWSWNWETWNIYMIIKNDKKPIPR